jgi:glycosyltransferase involved in cell wall biosynthesis
MTDQLDRYCGGKHLLGDLEFADAIYVSQAIRREVRAQVRNLPYGSVLRQGVDLDLFRPRAFRPMRSPLELLVAGRIHSAKAPDVAIEVVAELRRRDVAVKLTFAGAAVSRDYLELLKLHASALGVDNRVTWTGHLQRDELPRYYTRSDAVLFLSRWEEPAGLTYLEAMACGVPVVGHARGGAREIWALTTAATQAAALDASSIADELVPLTRDPERQLACRDAGLRMVREVASLDGYVRGLGDTLERASHSFCKLALAGVQRVPSPTRRPPSVHVNFAEDQ